MTRRWADYAASFLKDLAVRGFAVRTQETYGEDLKSFLKYLEIEQVSGPGELTLALLQGYQTSLYEQTRPRLCVGSQARRLAAVRSFCDFLFRRSLVLLDHSRKLVLPRVGKRLPSVILTTREALRFLRKIDTTTVSGVRDRAIFETLYSTGIRVGELVGLSPADVDLRQGYLRVRRGKGGRARVVPLGKVAAQWIRKYLRADRRHVSPASPLFLMTSEPRAMNRFCLGLRVKHWAAVAGLKKRVTCHTFRHTCATHLLRGRASLRHIQELLGHKRADTTAIYAQVEILDLKRVHQRCHPRARR